MWDKSTKWSVNLLTGTLEYKTQQPVSDFILIEVPNSLVLYRKGFLNKENHTWNFRKTETKFISYSIPISDNLWEEVLVHWTINRLADVNMAH